MSLSSNATIMYKLHYCKFECIFSHQLSSRRLYYPLSSRLRPARFSQRSLAWVAHSRRTFFPVTLKCMSNEHREIIRNLRFRRHIESGVVRKVEVDA